MKSMDIVGSALTAERFRMDTILQNIISLLWAGAVPKIMKKLGMWQNE